MKDMILFPEDIEQLNQVLIQLVTKANLLLAVLINKDGRLLTSQGSLEQVDTVSMAALVAGNSASTLAIAQLMGESEFSTMYHQGKDKHIYISIVDDNTFLALVFDDRTNIDRVKVFARQFDRQLKASLAQVYNKTEDQINLDLDMMNVFDSQPQPQYSQPGQQSIKMQPQEQYDFSNDPHNYAQNQQYNSLAGQPQIYSNENQLGRSSTEEDVFYIESNKNLPDQNDPNYLYLQNKIKETAKRKKEE